MSRLRKIGLSVVLLSSAVWPTATWASDAARPGPDAQRPEGKVFLANPPSRAAAPGVSASTVRSASSSSDEKEILLVRALEQPTSLQIEDKYIGEAVELLAEETGVIIEFDRLILGCLPYGSRTKVTATAENRPLKEILGALLRPLAATYAPEGGRIMIRPLPPLMRICRRATWDEVALIEKLYSTPWSRELADSLKFQFQDMPDVNAQANRKKIYDLAGSVGAGSAARVLEYACKQHGWEWYPDGNAISFCTRTRQVERQLERTMTAQYNEVPLQKVLLDVLGRAGLELKMEPGVLSSLPTQQVERFLMDVENVTVRQALELVAGMTGLGYFIEPDGVRIAASTFTAGSTSSDAAQSAAALRLTNPIVGQITIPGEHGITYSFFIRRKDLPPELGELVEQQLPEYVERLRGALSTSPAE